MQPNALINLLKRSHKQDRTGIFRKKYKIARMEVDWTGCPEIKAATLVKF